MELMQGLKSRRSHSALGAPAPTSKEIEQALACAVQAPDHGRLRPWRFHLVAGEKRDVLGELFVAASQVRASAEGRTLTPVQLDKFRALPLRAPLMIVATMKYQATKIPKLEQALAVGAAVQNLQLAFHGMGYGSIWRTGEFAQDPQVRQAFDVGPEDELIGFLYVGSVNSKSQMITAQQDLLACVFDWCGPVEGV